MKIIFIFSIILIFAYTTLYPQSAILNSVSQHELPLVDEHRINLEREHSKYLNTPNNLKYNENYQLLETSGWEWKLDMWVYYYKLTYQ